MEKINLSMPLNPCKLVHTKCRCEIIEENLESKQSTKFQQNLSLVSEEKSKQSAHDRQEQIITKAVCLSQIKLICSPPLLKDLYKLLNY